MASIEQKKYRRSFRYRLQCSAGMGVLVALITALPGNVGTGLHHHHQPIELARALVLGLVVALIVLVLWSIGSASRRARERRELEERARAFSPGRRRRGRRYSNG
jgi:hypothetical protein